MSYPRIYNAAVDMVDRNVAEGRASKPVFIDPNETLTYGELRGPLQPHGQSARHLCHPARSARGPAAAGYGRFSRGVLGRDQGWRRPGRPQHAADGRAVHLHPGRQPRQGAVHLGAAAAGRAADPRQAAVPQARVRLGRRGATVRAAVPRRAAASGAELRGRRHLQRRDGLLALLVGLDRHAERRPPRALEPDGDGAAVRPGLPRHPRGRSHLFGGQAVLRLRSRQRHVVSHVGRRHQRAAARSADAGAGVPHAEAASADRILRRSDAVCGDAGLSRRARRTTAPSACACASRPARRCRPRSARPSAPSSASTYSTASAPPRCCISTSATARARCATAPPASPYPATRSAWSTSRART